MIRAGADPAARGRKRIGRAVPCRAMRTQPDMSVDLAGVRLRNPIIAAAGTCGYVDEIADVLDPASIGAIVTKSITALPREGNPPWRLVEVPHGMLNAIGLANVGLDRFVAEILPRAARAGTVVIGSIAGGSCDDYVKVAAAIDASGALPAVELNVSCPNTADGMMFGASSTALRSLVGAVRTALKRTKLFVKLAPDAPAIVEIAAAAIEAGADALTLINTMPAMAIDVETRQARLSRGTGGLSGPAIHPIAVRIVHQVYEGVARAANVPIIGLGGAIDWRGAAEFILAGATAVGMGTAMFVDPRAPARAAKGLERWVIRQGCRAVRELIGKVEL